MLKPGLHTAMMVALDFNKLEQHIVATYQTDNVPTSKPVLFNMRYATARKIYGMYDFIDCTVVRPVRSARVRHHKAKSQPNRGPRGNNPW